MNYVIEITGATSEEIRRELSGESNLLGSGSRCSIQLSHPELEESALQIDVRADDVWIQNLNPYSIYLGAEEVKANAWAHWEMDSPIQLTQSISVELQKVVPKAAEGAAETKEASDASKKSLNTAKIVQIGLIVVCFAAAPIIMFSGKGETAVAASQESFEFNDTIELLTKNAALSPEIRVLRDSLQRAWMADVRWEKTNPDIVVRRYQQLTNHRLVRMDEDKLKQAGFNDDVNDAIADIRLLAKRRLSELDVN